MPTIRLEILVEASPSACFELSLSVDAHTASVADSGERARIARSGRPGCRPPVPDRYMTRLLEGRNAWLAAQLG